MHYISVIIVMLFSYVSGWNHLFSTRNVEDVPMSTSPRIGHQWYNVTTHFIKQPYDHFNQSEKRRFDTKYVQNLLFWEPNGPIYIFLKGDLGAYRFPIDRSFSFISVMAKETKGAMYLYERRYFGSSLPRIPPFHDGYYKYLNTTQTLADIADFIKYLKSKPEYGSSKVVLMGTDRSASLAVWMRVVYPNLVDAVVSSSAPLLAKKDAKEYLEHTAHIYDKYGYKFCLDEIEEKFLLFDYALENATYLEFYKKKHGICESNNFTRIEDRQNYMVFLHWTHYIIAFQGWLGYLEGCDHMYSVPGLNEACYDYHYDAYIESMSQNMNSELYLSCLELGQFPTTSAEKQPFMHHGPIDYFLTVCKDLFGIDEKRLDEGIAQTNQLYGGITPNVTNVVFVYGDMCPTITLGVQQNLSDLAPAFIVEKKAYSDIVIINGDESPEVIETIYRVKSLIKKWIGL